MPRPASAASRCSTVETRSAPSIRQVESVVSPTHSARAGISSTGSRSTRRNTIPQSTGAGLMVRWTSSPVCRPIPVAVIALRSVRCRSKIAPNRFQYYHMAAHGHSGNGPGSDLLVGLSTQKRRDIEILLACVFRSHTGGCSSRCPARFTQRRRPIEFLVIRLLLGLGDCGLGRTVHNLQGCTRHFTAEASGYHCYLELFFHLR